VIIVLCLVVGLALRLVTGHSFRGLAATTLRGETFLLFLLVSQAVLPLVQLTGNAARFAYYVWLAIFPCMIAVAWLNRHERGIPLLGAGLLLNLVVVALNGGMPVLSDAVRAAGSSAQVVAIPVGDFVHLIGTAATRLPWLADIIPLPGPAWLHSVASPGDLLLWAGIIAFIGGTEGSRVPRQQGNMQESG
jgi:hypothetical protein